MTTPAGQIALSDVSLEIYGHTSGQISMSNTHIYSLGGVTTGAAISMSNLQSKTWAPSCAVGTTNPAANGTYASVTTDFPTDSTIDVSCTANAVFSFTFTGTSPTQLSCSKSNNAFTNTATFTLASSFNAGRTATVNLTVTAGKTIRVYTINMATRKDPAGSTVTL